MPKRNRIAAVILVAVVVLIAIIALVSLRPAEEPDETVTPPADAAPTEFDHTIEEGTCSICHAPTPAHAAMEFNRCEDCHAYPTWDAQHPADTDCATCHKYDPPRSIPPSPQAA